MNMANRVSIGPLLFFACFCLFFMFSSAFSREAEAFPLIPDPEMTYGDLCDTRDRDFQNYRYGQRIAYCKRNVSKRQKERIYDEYGIPQKCRRRYTIDHFIPLSIGGSNADENLWPEHVKVKSTRPDLEEDVFEALRDGEITQKDAVEIIVKEKTSVKRISMQMRFKSQNCDIPDAYSP